MPFHIMVDVMTKEYVSDARQLQVKATLEILPLRSFMQDEDISDVSSGLSKLFEHINELSPQCPPDFRSDAHKVDYLRKAVSEYQNCSRIPIADITSQRYSDNSFVTTLHESIQNLKQVRSLLGSDESPSQTRIVSEGRENIATRMLQYGRHPRFVSHKNRSSTQNNRLSDSFKEALRLNLWVKYGASKWSPKHRCAPGAVQKHTHDRLKRGESSVHIVADFDRHEEDLHDSGMIVERHPDPEVSNEDLDRFEHIFHSGLDKEGVSDTSYMALFQIPEYNDQEIITNHVNSKMKEGSNVGCSAFFRLGGEI